MGDLPLGGAALFIGFFFFEEGMGGDGAKEEIDELSLAEDMDANEEVGEGEGEEAVENEEGVSVGFKDAKKPTPKPPLPCHS